MAKNDVITNFALLEYPLMHEGLLNESIVEERNSLFINKKNIKKEPISLCGNRKRKKKTNNSK